MRSFIIHTYFLPHYLRVIKSGRMRWVECVVHMERLKMYTKHSSEKLHERTTREM